MLLRGDRVWPGLVGGALLVELRYFLPRIAELGFLTALGASAVTTASIVAEPLFGALLLRRAVDVPTMLDRSAGVARFLTLGVLLSTTFSASVDVTSLCLAGVAPWSLFPTLWSTWWLGGAMGVRGSR